MSEDNTTQGPLTLAIDIGGSGLKMLVLDASGEPVTERTRVPTPRPALPAPVLDALVSQFGDHGRFDRVSVGFPGVVVDGVTKNAPNLDPSWAGFDLAAALTERAGRPTRVANDADVQGFGAIEGRGVELVVTLGTGFGSALFVDGRLVPNLEMGHHVFEKSRTYEEWLGQAARDEGGKKRWNRRLERAIASLRALFNFNTMYIGGGNAKKIGFDLPEDVRVVPNIAGILGGIRLWEA